jgi:hypothetical protein
MATIHALALAAYPIIPWLCLLVVEDGVGEVEVGLEEPVDVESDVALTNTYSSPVVSELTNMRFWESNSNPTGLKQLSGHTELSALENIVVAAVVLSAAARGTPLLKSRDTTL